MFFTLNSFNYLKFLVSYLKPGLQVNTGKQTMHKRKLNYIILV